MDADTHSLHEIMVNSCHSVDLAKGTQHRNSKSVPTVAEISFKTKVDTDTDSSKKSSSSNYYNSPVKNETKEDGEDSEEVKHTIGECLSDFVTDVCMCPCILIWMKNFITQLIHPKSLSTQVADQH